MANYIKIYNVWVTNSKKADEQNIIITSLFPYKRRPVSIKIVKIRKGSLAIFIETSNNANQATSIKHTINMNKVAYQPYQISLISSN